MSLDRSKILIVSIALVAVILSFAIVFQLGYRPADSDGTLEPVKQDASETHVNPERIESEASDADSSEAGKAIPYGRLQWTPKKSNENKPEEKLSTYEKEEKVIKPASKDGRAIQ